MEMMPSQVKQQLDVIYRPHPLLPVADCKKTQQAWRPGLTVHEILLANGVDPHQLIVVILDDRLLTVEEWKTVCPIPGQIINVKAQVNGGGGGGGGSNAVQIVAMIALVVIAVAAPYLAPASWGALAAGGGLSMTGALMTAGLW